jgi:NADH-quinone oxidoreductase subunit F
MPAYAEEIDEALQEGVELMTLTQPVAVLRDRAKRITGLRCVTMSLGEFDRSGRRRAKASAAELEVEADQVIAAIGQKLDARQLLGGAAVALTDDGFISADPVTGQTSLDWVFAGGDAASGPSSVVEAIAAGERAAVAMDLYLSGSCNAFWRVERPSDTFFDPEADPVGTPREKMPSIGVERRRHNFDEVELPWNEAVALKQACRCLRCDFGKTVITPPELTLEQVRRGRTVAAAAAPAAAQGASR